MSIRVNNQEVGLNTQSVSTDHSRATQAGQGKTVSASTGDDHFSFSATAQNVSAALETGGTARSGRLQNLAALVASGKYEVPVSDLSRSIIVGAIRIP